MTNKIIDTFHVVTAQKKTNSNTQNQHRSIHDRICSYFERINKLTFTIQNCKMLSQNYSFQIQREIAHKKCVFCVYWGPNVMRWLWICLKNDFLSDWTRRIFGFCIRFPMNLIHMIVTAILQFNSPESEMDKWENKLRTTHATHHLYSHFRIGLKTLRLGNWKKKHSPALYFGVTATRYTICWQFNPFIVTGFYSLVSKYQELCRTWEE